VSISKAKHFTRLSYDRSKISWCILKTLLEIDGPAYFAMVVIYERKKFMKLTTGVNLINLFSIFTDKTVK